MPFFFFSFFFFPAVQLLTINLESYNCTIFYFLLEKDRQTAKSLVVGRPILLALEDIDGTPSFLEKALRFLEGHGEPLFL